MTPVVISLATALAVSGAWHGELQRAGHVWNAIVRVEERAGEVLARVSFPDFGMFQLEAHELAVTDSTIRLRTTWIESGFAGRVSGEYLEGTWTFGSGPAVARFHRASRDPGILLSEDVTVTADDGASLAGRLILPANGSPPHPAMILTHGSGPDTRATGPYVAKANLAALHGLAVLIWDKRGAGESTGDGAYRIERLGADARTMLEHLRADPRIDATRVGVGGISQGGWVAPMLASEDPEVAFVFGTALPGLSPAEQNVFSLRTRLEDSGLAPSETRAAIRTLRAIYEYYRVGDARTRERAERHLAGADSAWVRSDLFRRFLFWTEDRLPESVEPAAYATMFVDPLTWWREITVPVLGMWGGDDANIPAEYSRAVIAAALEHAGSTDRRLLVFPHAGHGLSRTDGRDGDWPRAAPGVVEIMGAWFERRSQR